MPKRDSSSQLYLAGPVMEYAPAVAVRPHPACPQYKRLIIILVVLLLSNARLSLIIFFFVKTMEYDWRWVFVLMTTPISLLYELWELWMKDHGIRYISKRVGLAVRCLMPQIHIDCMFVFCCLIAADVTYYDRPY